MATILSHLTDHSRDRTLEKERTLDRLKKKRKPLHVLLLSSGGAFCYKVTVPCTHVHLSIAICCVLYCTAFVYKQAARTGCEVSLANI